MGIRLDIFEEHNETITVNYDFIKKLRIAAERQKAAKHIIKDVDRFLELCKKNTRFNPNELREIMRLTDQLETSDDFEITEE